MPLKEHKHSCLGASEMAQGTKALVTKPSSIPEIPMVEGDSQLWKAVLWPLHGCPDKHPNINKQMQSFLYKSTALPGGNSSVRKHISMAWGPELGPRTRVNITYTVVYTYHSSAGKVETGPGWSWGSLVNLGQSGDLQGKERPYLKGGGWCSQDDTERYPPGSAWHMPILPTPRGTCTHSTALQTGFTTAESTTENPNSVYEQEHSSKRAVFPFHHGFAELWSRVYTVWSLDDTLHLSGFWNNPEERSPVIIVLQARREAGL